MKKLLITLTDSEDNMMATGREQTESEEGTERRFDDGWVALPMVLFLWGCLRGGMTISTNAIDGNYDDWIKPLAPMTKQCR